MREYDENAPQESDIGDEFSYNGMGYIIVGEHHMNSDPHRPEDGKWHFWATRKGFTGSGDRTRLPVAALIDSGYMAEKPPVMRTCSMSLLLHVNEEPQSKLGEIAAIKQCPGIRAVYCQAGADLPAGKRLFSTQPPWNMFAGVPTGPSFHAGKGFSLCTVPFAHYFWMIVPHEEEGDGC